MRGVQRLPVGLVALATALEALASAKEHQEQGFLGVEAVFGLIEDYGLGAVQHGVRDLCVAVGGEAVHEDGVGLGVGHEGLVDLVGLEDGGASGGLVLEAHGGADISVDGVGTGDRFDGVVEEGDGTAGLLGDFDGLVDDVELGDEGFGGGDVAVCRRVARRRA